MTDTSATIGLEPEVSDSSAGEAKEKLQDAIGSLEFGRDTGGAIGSGVGAQIGGAPGAVVGQSLGQGLGAASQRSGLGGMAAGLGLAALSTMATGISVLADASPTFGKMLTMLTKIFQLALRPLGRLIAKQVIPFAKKGLEMASTFNEMSSSNGLKVAIGAVLFGNPFTTMVTLLTGIVGGLGGASIGALIGAILGSVVPGIGTVVGAQVGAVVGGLVGSVIGPFMLRTVGFIQSLARTITQLPMALHNLLSSVLTSFLSALAGLANAIPGVSGVSFTGNVTGGGGANRPQRTEEERKKQTSILEGILKELKNGGGGTGGTSTTTTTSGSSYDDRRFTST